MIYRNWRPKYTTHPVSLLLELYTKLYVCNEILGDNYSNRRMWKRHGIIPTEWIERERGDRKEVKRHGPAGAARLAGLEQLWAAPRSMLWHHCIHCRQPRHAFYSLANLFGAQVHKRNARCVSARLRSLPGHVSQDPDEMSPRQTQTAVRPLPVP